jgi:hypothetical protein
MASGKRQDIVQFHNHGLNMALRSCWKMTSLLPNPCAAVVMERPLLQGEVMTLRIEPHCRLSYQSEVKVFLTTHTPEALKLDQHLTYFTESNVLDR